MLIWRTKNGSCPHLSQEERRGNYGPDHEAPPGTYHGRIYDSPELREKVILISDTEGGSSINGPSGRRNYIEIHRGPGMSEGCLLGQTDRAGQANFINQVNQAINYEQSQGTYNGITVIIEDRN